MKGLTNAVPGRAGRIGASSVWSQEAGKIEPVLIGRCSGVEGGENGREEEAYSLSFCWAFKFFDALFQAANLCRGGSAKQKPKHPEGETKNSKGLHEVLLGRNGHCAKPNSSLL